MLHRGVYPKFVCWHRYVDFIDVPNSNEPIDNIHFPLCDMAILTTPRPPLDESVEND